MILSKLAINQFRNIEHVSLALSAQFNLFYGDNGSGKTSILEAIYYLAMAKSFRSHYSRYVIQDGKHALTVFAEGNDAEGEHWTMGVSKQRGGDLVMKHQGEEVASQGEWIHLLPVLLCNHDTYQLLDAGPKIRRQFIDWGVFHVKHHFFGLWQTLQKVLRQRNSALRAELPNRDIEVWNAQLVQASVAMTKLREDYLATFIEVFRAVLDKFIALGDLKISFYPGWAEKEDYATVLHEALHRDRQYGYTRYGPHRADLKFLVDGKPADEVLSRGQQKVFVAALKLAQGRMLKDIGKKAIYLVDDLPSELDADKQVRVVDLLGGMDAQVFVTGIVPDLLAELLKGFEMKMFHVKHGVCDPVR